MTKNILKSQLEKEITEILSVGSEHKYNINLLDETEFTLSWKLGELEDPNCYLQSQITDEGIKEIAQQRDFYAEKLGSDLKIVVDPDIQDTKDNILRWLIPRMLLEKHQYVIHSSCVVFDNKAYLFLGKSGSGKTTLAKIANQNSGNIVIETDQKTENLVLGDDMNLVFNSKGRNFVKPIGLGQQIQCDKSIAGPYELEAMFLLNKSMELKIEDLSNAESFRALTISLANIFWPTLSKIQVKKINSDLIDILSRTSIYNLHFPKDKDVFERFKVEYVKSKI